MLILPKVSSKILQAALQLFFCGLQGQAQGKRES